MEQIVFKLDMIQTLALAAMMLFVGYRIRRWLPFLERYSIPAAVVGGLLFASVALVLRLSGWVAFQFDTSLQAPLMIAFFTTIGLGANLRLLKIGGPQVLLFFALATVLAILQGGLGVALSEILGVHPYLGLIAGPITLTGGHGTGAAFGKLLEESYQFAGGFTLAMAAATFGVVSGGLIAGPITTALIKRWNPPHTLTSMTPEVKEATAQLLSFEREVDKEPPGEPPTAYRLLKIIAIILIAMWIGSLLSAWLNKYFTLPAYIGAMIAAAFICNSAGTVKLTIEQRVVNDLGTIALSLFLSMALMSLKLHELLDLAIPMIILLAAQVLMMAAFAYYMAFRVMGRDYDAAVMAGGLCGFGLGATSNAMASMEAITEHYGPAPRAFLVVPIVGAFLIDFTNALIITGFINFLK